jgi:CHRD domain
MDTHTKTAAAALAAMMAVTGAMLACSNDPTAAAQSTTYVAQMSGANEVPSIALGANGTGTFTLTGRTLSYVINVNGLSGTVAASHIHGGAAGANGTILYPFTPAAVQSGQVASGSIDLNQPVSNGSSSISGDSLLKLLNAGLLYTNVHTAAYPGGEIRGQITRQQSSSNGY